MFQVLDKFRQPIFVLIAGSILLALAFGIRHSFGIFLIPISEKNQWGREVFAMGLAFQNLMWGIWQPFTGRISDKIGAGVVVLVGAILYSLGLFLMGTLSTKTGFVIASGILGIGISGVTFPIFGAISRSVTPEKRSVSIGIAMSSASLGQFVMLPASLTLLQNFGPTLAFGILSVLSLIMLALAIPMFEKPIQQTTTSQDLSLREVLTEAFSHKGFWLLCFGFFVCGFHILFIMTHVPAFLIDKGLSPQIGTIVLALIGLFNIFGTYYAGFLGSKIRKPLILSFIYGSRAVIILIFILFPISNLTAYVFASLMGILWLSTIPPTQGTITTVFGIKNMSMLYGIAFLFHQVGAFLGGWLGGKVYDVTGSYDIVWYISIALGVFGAIINYPIEEKKVTRLERQAV
ncbi:MAG: MFS transporter [Candidatus Fonsibacter lacus]|uniref:MFS transporter n=1 Tax=Candidatus Fonsibacter lacus TaxID=2576439 RepID=A0A966LY29_9PROT|nr:MFS transporter [Candidatus Fonsibacter lacus]